MSTPMDELIDTAQALADAGGAAALSWFRQTGLVADNKANGGGFDPVTAADRAAEAAMRAILARRRPDDAILGEEEGSRSGTSGLTWVLDPIDGTRAFLSGLPTWGVLVGLDDGARGILGVIEQPHTGERWLGVPGRGAWLTRAGVTRPIAVRPCAGLGQAILFTTAPEIFTPPERAGFEAVRAQARLTRYGVDCYAYALLAMGCIDLVIESGLYAYDIAAPKAVIEAAGGIVTDWRGGDCRGGGRVLAAGDAGVHAAALAWLAAVPDA